MADEMESGGSAISHDASVEVAAQPKVDYRAFYADQVAKQERKVAKAEANLAQARAGLEAAKADQSAHEQEGVQ